jgi:uncharacterized protein (TIGR02246 family)
LLTEWTLDSSEIFSLDYFCLAVDLPFLQSTKGVSNKNLRRITMNTQAAETEIQTLIDTYRQAVMAKDVKKVMALYADDIVSFDAIQALQFKGKVAYQAHWEACMEMCPGPHKFDFHQVQISAADDIAFAHWLAYCGGTNEKGEEQACWMRVTACYKRLAGQWKIVHEHWSAPFDPMAGTAIFDLQP